MDGYREERRGGMNREIEIGVCALPYVKDSWWEMALQLRELDWVLRGELEGWDGWGEGDLRERGLLYTYR